MTTLVLAKTWLNRLDTGAAISAATGRGSRNQQFSNDVGVRTYAAGRQRAIGVQGERGSVGFQLLLLDQATKDLLRTWKGIALQVRDHRGQRWFGVVAEVTVGEYTPITLYSATVTLLTTSIVEGV